MTVEAKIPLDLPGLDEVLKTEIGILRMDVARLEMQSETTYTQLARTNGEIEALKRQFLRLRARRDELNLRATAEQRILKERRRMLFELEQDVR